MSSRHDAWARDALRAVVRRATIQAEAALARLQLVADRLIARASRR